jgi:predicted acylesterase/phospholipase RssA
MSKIILSFDGGGIRGAAATQFLFHVEEQLKSDHALSLRDCVDLYAGTSTSSIIALTLATTELTVSEINDLYNPENAKTVFTENKGFLEIPGVNAPKYEAEGKTNVFKTVFKDAKIGDVPQGKHVLVVTYDIARRQPKIIKSNEATDRSLASYAVADASSAVPTYFPTREIEINQQDYWLIDGGVVANNPTMCAIAEARRIWHDVSVNDFLVLSIGTGYRTRKVNGPASQKWGVLEWFLEGHIIDILTDERIIAYEALTVMKPGNYIRINAEMKQQSGLPNPPDDDMDDISPSNINKLKKMGDWWFDLYGDSVVKLLCNQYTGPSLDHINSATGKPISRIN